MVKDEIQNYPTSDSPNHDAFEGIVELYYEIKGYITSSGKWFWKKADCIPDTAEPLRTENNADCDNPK